MTNKLALRTEIIAIRNNLSRQEILARSNAIHALLIEMAVFKKSQIVMGYMSFRNEVETKKTLIAAQGDGKKTVLPRVIKHQGRMVAALVENLAKDLVVGSYHILEPDPANFEPIDPAKIDLVLVPGLVFDRLGNRLGYGGGYYDRFLPRCTRAVTVALAYQFQVVKDISPMMEDHDHKMDFLVTEKGIKHWPSSGA